MRANSIQWAVEISLWKSINVFRKLVMRIKVTKYNYWVDECNKNVNSKKKSVVFIKYFTPRKNAQGRLFGIKDDKVCTYAIFRKSPLLECNNTPKGPNFVQFHIWGRRKCYSLLLRGANSTETKCCYIIYLSLNKKSENVSISTQF